MKMEQQ